MMLVDVDKAGIGIQEGINQTDHNNRREEER